MFMSNVVDGPTHIFRGAFPVSYILALDLNAVIFPLRYRTLLWTILLRSILSVKSHFEGQCV